MVCWALSGLSQKPGCSMRAVSWSRCARLPATSKRVPELGEPVDQLIGSAAEVGIHETPSCENPAGPGACQLGNGYSITNPVRTGQFGLAVGSRLLIAGGRYAA